MRILASLLLLVILAGCGRGGSSAELEQRNENVAKQLLAWNKKNLVSSADLRKEEITQLFAPEFQIKANGRFYDGNYKNYFEFLNKFRENIYSLEYELQEFISDEDKVAIPLRAKIVRTDGSTQLFDAIMILGFNKAGKITLWQEVYAEHIDKGESDQ